METFRLLSLARSLSISFPTSKFELRCCTNDAKLKEKESVDEEGFGISCSVMKKRFTISFQDDFAFLLLSFRGHKRLFLNANFRFRGENRIKLNEALAIHLMLFR